MIIPNIELRNHAVRRGKRLRRVPPQVVSEIVLITLLAQFLWERMILPFLGIRNIRPFRERPIDTDAVVVELVAATNPID